MGVNVERMRVVTFGLGSALVGAAGCLFIPIYYIYPDIGGQFTLIAFVITILGGLGSTVGAIIGGLILGLFESLTATYIGMGWAPVGRFVIFVAVLIFIPGGVASLLQNEKVREMKKCTRFILHHEVNSSPSREGLGERFRYEKIFAFHALVLMALLPLLGLNSYLMHILILVIMWSVIGMAWNLLGGYCGQVSFGHAAFFGVGAYTSGMLYSKLGISAWWGAARQHRRGHPLRPGHRLHLPAAARPLLRPGHARHRRHPQDRRREPCTASPAGPRHHDPRADLDRKDLVLLHHPGHRRAVLLLVKQVIGSKLGYYFVAIREDQDAAESLGINTTLYKTIALC